jgi:hypothetical protein
LIIPSAACILRRMKLFKKEEPILISRTDIINHFVQKKGFATYLEIGVQRGQNFRGVTCEKKVGVDPNTDSAATVNLTSDAFFETNTENFDIIFVDGLHTAIQVFKDLTNALSCLKDGGILVCHDMNPRDKKAQKVPRSQDFWNGDCWVAWVWLRATRPDLEMVVLDTDCGCGVIRKGAQIPLEIDSNITYENLAANREKWLNLKPADHLHALDW